MIRFIEKLWNSFTDYAPALRFIFKHRFAWIFLIPVILNLILLTGMYSAVSSFIDYLQSSSLEASQLQNTNFWGADVLRWLLSVSIGILVQILFFFVFTYTSGNIILLLLSPVLAYISEKTDKILTGKDYPFNTLQFLKDIVRGIRIVFRNLFFESLITIGLFFFVFIPVVGQIVGLLSPVILFFVASYFNGISFVDYILERKKMTVKERIVFNKQQRGLIIGNGIPFTLVLFIPFMGLFLAEFFAIVASVAAVLSVANIKNIKPPTDYE
jgi:CysZ protein